MGFVVGQVLDQLVVDGVEGQFFGFGLGVGVVYMIQQLFQFCF